MNTWMTIFLILLALKHCFVYLYTPQIFISGYLQVLLLDYLYISKSFLQIIFELINSFSKKLTKIEFSARILSIAIRECFYPLRECLSYFKHSLLSFYPFAIRTQIGFFKPTSLQHSVLPYAVCYLFCQMLMTKNILSYMIVFTKVDNTLMLGDYARNESVAYY